MTSRIFFTLRNQKAVDLKNTHMVNIPIALLSVALGHASIMPGVHWESFIHTQTIQETINTQANKSSGEESLVYTENKVVIDKMYIRLVNNRAYILNNNATALHNLLNLNLNITRNLVNKWIYLPKSFHQYTQIIAGLSMATVVNELQMNGKVIKGKITTYNHQKAIPLSGSVPGSSIKQTVYLTDVKAPLPIAVVDQEGTNRSVTYFGPWKAAKIYTPLHYLVYSSHLK